MGVLLQLHHSGELGWQFGWYFRDRWQASRDLTRSLGLRYEYCPQLTRANIGVETVYEVYDMMALGRVGLPFTRPYAL